MIKQLIAFFSLPLLIVTSTYAQVFVTANDAFRESNLAYSLTTAVDWQGGAIWNQQKIDMREDFSVSGQIYLGNKDGDGADGMAFVLQNNCTNEGSSGGGLGYGEMSGNSFAIEFDTYSNNGESGNDFNGDPSFDHIGFVSMGDVSHNSANALSGTVGILPANANAEDGLFHDFIIDWNAANTTMTVTIDGSQRISQSVNLLNGIFGGDPYAYWGFTAATGGLNNRHRVKINEDRKASLYDQELCEEGSITLTLADLAPGESIAWTPTTGVSDPNGTTVTFSPTATTTYEMVRTDACGNPLEDEFTITIEDPVATGSTNEVSCSYPNTGTVSVEVEGGEEPYTYLWPGGATDAEATGFGPGDHEVTVTDYNGCQVNATSSITLDMVLEMEVLTTDLVCPKDNSGEAELTVVGGFEPFAALWSTGQTGLSVSGLSAGAHAVAVEDAMGCKGTAPFELTEPEEFELGFSPTDIYCDSKPVGAISATVSGGTAPYAYEWNTGDSEQAIAGIYAGDYTLTITDDAGCTTSGQGVVNSNSFMVADFAMDTVTLADGFNVQFIDQSPTNVHTWLWEFGDGETSSESDPFHVYTEPGTYELYFTVIGGDNCTDVTGTVIFVPKRGDIWFPNAFSPNGDRYNPIWRAYGDILEDGVNEFKIFDRWGEIVYESTDYRAGWDGTVMESDVPAQSDVYSYWFRTILPNGEREYIGRVTLLR